MAKKKTKKTPAVEKYKVACYCKNCTFTGTVEFPKGTLVPGRFVCPNCDCERAKSMRIAEVVNATFTLSGNTE